MNNQVLANLDLAEIKFLRLVWCDNANVIRAKAVHKNRIEAHLKHGVAVTQALQAMPVMYDSVIAESGLTPVGEISLVPDWNTFNALPYSPSHARVMGDMVLNGQPWSYCPRHFLKRMIAQAAAEGLEIKAAFENEFYLLLNSAGKIIPADETIYGTTLSMDKQLSVIDDIADALIAQNISVEQYYPESGPGQQEISVLYTDALKAADRQIVFRETVKAIAFRHNLIASFLPKIFANSAGSGCHLHLSLWKDGENLIPSPEKDGKLSSLAKKFLAGILAHLPALMALTIPSPNSYRRILPHYWSGAFLCWGYNNREAPLRIPTNPELPSPTHIEYKTSDASANPYIALGGVIAAGLDGIRQNLSLGEPVQVDPGHMAESERLAAGIERLPPNLGIAIENLQQDRVLLDALGADLATSYLAVKKTEWEAIKDYSLEEEVKLLLERY